MRRKRPGVLEQHALVLLARELLHPRVESLHRVALDEEEYERIEDELLERLELSTGEGVR